MLTVEFRSDHGPFLAAVHEAAALWADLPDGEARAARFWEDFRRAQADYASYEEVVDRGAVTLCLRPGPAMLAILAELRAGRREGVA